MVRSPAFDFGRGFHVGLPLRQLRGPVDTQPSFVEVKVVAHVGEEMA